MSDVKQLLEHALETATRVGAPADEFDRFVRYGERRRRNQRLAAGAVALALALAVAGALVSVARSPAPVQPANDGVIGPTGSGPCFAGEQCWDMDIYVVRIDGTEVTRLGDRDQRDLASSWSPDGGRIAFFVGEGVDGVEGVDETSAGISTMAADGTDVRRLTDGGGQWIDAFPSFSPDGSRIVFQSDRTGTGEIYVMDADGSNEVLLSDFDDDPRDDYTPTWSPDGERIAFVRGEIPPGGAGELWVMDADGSNAHALPGVPPVDFPSWSPDGTRIAFELGAWPDVRVGVLEVATGIVTDLGTGFHPIWSPDSTRLAITDPDGGFSIVELADPSHRQIVSESAWWAAAWSPDGEWIVFNGPGLTQSSG